MITLFSYDELSLTTQVGNIHSFAAGETNSKGADMLFDLNPK